MNDPVPNQDESERTLVPAPQSTDAVTLPQSGPLATSDPSPVASQLQSPDAAQQAPERRNEPITSPAPPAPLPNPASVPPVPDKLPQPTRKAASDLMPPPIIIGPAEVPVTGGRWENDLEQSSTSTGVDAGLMRRIVKVESGGRVDAKAGTSSAAGIFQITGGTWNDLRIRYPQLNLTNRMDPSQQARVAPYYMKEIQENLHRVLGRAPNAGESYLGWFLGPVGAANALRHSADTSTSLAVDPKAVAANPGVFNKAQTVGDLVAWANRKMGENAPFQQAPGVTRESQVARMGLQQPLESTAMRVPFSAADDAKRATQREQDAYSLVQAAQASATQDWMIANMLKGNGKTVYDPGFSITPQTLQRDDIRALPERYLPFIGKAMSQQDLEFRVRQSEADFERERRLDATSGSTMLRLAVGMADPGGLALSLLSPAGAFVQGGRLAKIAAAAVDGAVGSLAGEVPAMLNKPSYEAQEALWAGLTGTAGYLALNRHAWAPHVATEVDQAVKGMSDLKVKLESGTMDFGPGSVGAAKVAGYRDAVREDVAGLTGLDTEKSGREWMDRLRFDFAKLKNSDNSMIAKAADLMGMDTVGNRDRTKAVTRPIEYDARMMEERANIFLAREYNAAAEDYRTRHGIGWFEWQRGGEEEFQRLGSGAVRNTDPLVTFDPAVSRYADAWRKTAEYWRDRARNPGLDRGETIRPLPNAEHWSDNPNYLPRYTNWDKFNQLNSEFGNDLKRLFGEAIAGKNPDLDKDFAYKLGEFYYQRLAKVEAGQELTVQKALSGSDMDELRRQLLDRGYAAADVDKALYEVDEKAAASGGKTLTSRQKPRTLMDENFEMTLSGRSGSRQVAVGEIWEDNLRSITHAYNRQMSGAVALGQFRIENPQWHPTKNPEAPRWIADGIHSDGDWQKFLAQARAHDGEVRYADKLRTAEVEIKQLQWMYDALRGVPREMDRSRLGQFIRVLQNVNFVRLMSQAGWSSIAEFGNLLGGIGIKHTMKALPALGDFIRDARTGRLARDELEDLEYIFAAGTDHLRGSGMTWTGHDHATALNDGSKLSQGLDMAESVTKKAARYTSMVSLAPLTTLQERFAQKAVLSKFRGAATDGDKLSGKRMRLLGLDADMQERVLDEIRKHDEFVYGENGRKIRLLGLEKWDPQVRSAFEFAVNTWTRRIIQQNDKGQMHSMISSPLGKLIFQFRNFTLGAWSKQTLSSFHMADPEAAFSFLSSMVFGAMAYSAQTALNGLGLQGEEAEKYSKDRLSHHKIVAAAFQRAGASSLMPGVYDLGAGFFGADPFFDTRATQHPSAGLMSNPTFGLIDSVYTAMRGVNKSALQGDTFTSQDGRNLSRAINVLHNYPIMMQTINATSQLLPSH